MAVFHAVVSGMVTWAALGVAVKQFVAEATWLYSMTSSLLMTVGIGSSVAGLGIVVVLHKNRQD